MIQFQTSDTSDFRLSPLTSLSDIARVDPYANDQMQW